MIISCHSTELAWPSPHCWITTRCPCESDTVIRITNSAWNWDNHKAWPIRRMQLNSTTHRNPSNSIYISLLNPSCQWKWKTKRTQSVYGKTFLSNIIILNHLLENNKIYTLFPFLPPFRFRMCIRTTGNGMDSESARMPMLMPFPLSINSVHNLSIILKTFLIKWEFFSSYHTRFFLFTRSPSLLTQ